MESEIKSGWRGNINGFIENTNSHIKVNQVELKLDYDTAWALCNLLHEKPVLGSLSLEKDQIKAMLSLGSSLGRLIDHPSANNYDRKIIK